MDAIRERFGRDAVGYATVSLNRKRSVPDAFRELAERDLDMHEADPAPLMPLRAPSSCERNQLRGGCPLPPGEDPSR
jgi:hypothetical protein